MAERESMHEMVRSYWMRFRAKGVTAGLLIASLGERPWRPARPVHIVCNPGSDGADRLKTREAVSALQANSGISENGAWNDMVTRETLAGTLRTTRWVV
jgi:hypothetical protein